MISSVLQFLLDAIDDLIFLVNDKLQIQAMSAEARALFGREEQGFPLSDICAKGDCEAVVDIIAHKGERALASAETRALLRLPDGRDMPAMLCLHDATSSGAKERSFLILAKPLAPRTAKFGRPPTPRNLASSTEPIVCLDAADFEIVECNKAAEVLFGLRREEIIGSTSSRFAPDEDEARKRVRGLKSQLESAGIVRAPCPIKGPWNTVINCEVTYIALYDAEGAIAGLTCILRDLGEEKARFSEVRKLAAKLSACKEELDALASELPDEDRGTEAELCLADLSSRQLEVARLVVAGETTKSISQRLGLSESTVKSHITGLFKKTGTKTRAQLIGFIHSRHVKLD